MDKRILLIDADGDCEEAVSIAGSSHGYRTNWVHSSRDAFEALDRNLSLLGLIVLDIDRGTHGQALLEAISSCGDRPPILVLTGLEESYMTPISRRHGAAACLGKPIDRERLARVIGKISNQRRLSSDRWGHPVPSSNRSNGHEVKEAVRGIAIKLRP
jgi:DNA-binding NtrC family response regulator